MAKNIFLALGLLLLATACNKPGATKPNSTPMNRSVPSTRPEATAALLPSSANLLQEPISDGLLRLTKKPFGLKVSPANSPVSPEKFSGYHTGIDFETTTAEKNTDVKITAACPGTVALEKYATGYGGVFVQHCKINNQDVTVIYGHLRLSSIIPKVGETLNAGDTIGVLGTGYSSETDGERKHLHFGIHIGTTVNIKGYVQSQSELSGWLDAQKYLQ